MQHWFSGALRSLTIWVNTVAGAVVLALPEVQSTLPDLAQYLPAEIYRWVALALVLSNLGLRIKTRTALNLK